MNLGQTLLNEDARAVRHLRVSKALREHRADYLATHGDTSTAIAAVLQKCGPMSKNLLIVALADKQPATVSRMANRMLRSGALLLEDRGAIEVLRLAGSLRAMQGSPSRFPTSVIEF